MIVDLLWALVVSSWLAAFAVLLSGTALDRWFARTWLSRRVMAPTWEWLVQRLSWVERPR